MEELILILPWILGGLILVVALAALRKPLRWVLTLLARSAAALAALFLLSRLGGLIGIHLGVNPVNALVVGALGAPGFGLLLLLGWAFH